MTRADLIIALKRRNEGLSTEEITLIISSIFENMLDSLRKGDRIEIRGFGVFLSKIRVGFTARNPKTSEKIPVASSITARFKAGKNLFNRVNDNV